MVPVIFLTSLVFSTAIIADSTGKLLLFNIDTVAMPVTASLHGVGRVITYTSAQLRLCRDQCPYPLLLSPDKLHTC